MQLGDGLRGQAQDETDLLGLGVGGSWNDRFDVDVTRFSSREYPEDPEAWSLRGKVRLGDLDGGAATVGVHVSLASASLRLEDGQGEKVDSWDFALPVEFYLMRNEDTGARGPLGIYVGPRVVLESFSDRRSGELTDGVLLGLFGGVVARSRYFSLTAELNAARTPSFGADSWGIRRGLVVLPLVQGSLILPF